MKFKRIELKDGFQKDLKRLSKKYPSLKSDLETFIKAQLLPYHKLNVDNQGIVPIAGISIPYPTIYKAIKFACKSLKGNGAKSGIRIIYAHFGKEDRIELVELYYKGEEDNEDRERIKSYYCN